MLYITAIIKTDFHTYFYRTIVLKKGTGNPLLDTNVLQGECKVEKKDEKNLVSSALKRNGFGIIKKEGFNARNSNDF